MLCIDRSLWVQECFLNLSLCAPSVGYSTCHWCHVMERESFEDEEIGKLLSDNFVCIKLDREERPDVDKVYMTFIQVRAFFMVFLYSAALLGTLFMLVSVNIFRQQVEVEVGPWVCGWCLTFDHSLEGHTSLPETTEEGQASRLSLWESLTR